MYMTEPEVNGLRDYLLAGGFLMLDDFWGSAEWANFEAERRPSTTSPWLARRVMGHRLPEGDA